MKKNKIEIFEVGEKDSSGKHFTYTQVTFIEGWADANQFKPLKYDLVNIKFQNKTVNGWWDGLHWVGLKVNSDDVALKWKKKEDYE
jgi:hypothetical protein